MEKKPEATISTPPTAVNGSPDGSHAAPDMAAANRTLFVGMALEMSWQLAVVVIVPIVGGYMADSRFHTSPWLTLTGLVLAAAGVFGVLIRIVRVADRRVTNTDNTKPKGMA